MARYPGGKNSEGVFQRIINQIPPHRVRIEAFMGSAPLLRLMLPAEMYIGVDVNAEAIVAITASGERRRRRSPLPVISAGRTGNGDACRQPSPEAGLVATIPGSGDARSRTTRSGVQVLQTDAIEFLRAYRFTGDEFVYCDPPYLIESRSHKGRIYASEFTDWQHLQLLKLVRRLKCMVMISGYWSKLYEELLEGWRVIAYPAYTRGHQVAKEYLWMNYHEPTQLHDYSYLGKNFRAREKVKLRHKSLLGKFRRLAPLEQQMFLAAAITECAEPRAALNPVMMASIAECRDASSSQLTHPADEDADASSAMSKI